jgi:hypothetical protein
MNLKQTLFIETRVKKLVPNPDNEGQNIWIKGTIEEVDGGYTGVDCQGYPVWQNKKGLVGIRWDGLDRITFYPPGHTTGIIKIDVESTDYFNYQ